MPGRRPATHPVPARNAPGRIFDFETSGWGTVAFDAAYLIAPFPSCWCFATLPTEVAEIAVGAYEARLEAAGVTLGPDWADLITAALAGLIIARGPMLAGALQEDHDWGTTTVRPRLLAWLGSFTGRAGHGTLPRLQAAMGAMRERLTERWARCPDSGIPGPRRGRRGTGPGPRRLAASAVIARVRTSVTGRRMSSVAH